MNHLLYEQHQEYTFKLHEPVTAVSWSLSKWKPVNAFYLLLLLNTYFDYCMEIRSHALSHGVDSVHNRQQRCLEAFFVFVLKICDWVFSGMVGVKRTARLPLRCRYLQPRRCLLSMIKTSLKLCHVENFDFSNRKSRHHCTLK